MQARRTTMGFASGARQLHSAAQTPQQQQTGNRILKPKRTPKHDYAIHEGLPVARYPFRVTWENTDTAGYIHNSVVFRYFEIGELEFLRTLDAHWSAFPECGFPRIHVEASFLTPLRFDDLCAVETQVRLVRAAGYALAHRVCRGDEVAVTGGVTVCCISTATGRARPLPPKLRDALETFTNADGTRDGIS